MELQLHARPGAIPTARHWARDHAERLELSQSQIRIVELLTSELVANTVLHGPDGPIDVALTADVEQVRIAVTDTSDDRPIMRTTGPEVPGGHGMRLVDRLSTAWGVDIHGDATKTVWFTVARGSD